MDTNRDFPQALNYWRRHSNLTHLMPQKNFCKFHHVHQNTLPLSLPLRSGISSQTKGQRKDMYLIRMPDLQKKCYMLCYKECLIDQTGETQAHAKKLLREA